MAGVDASLFAHLAPSRPRIRAQSFRFQLDSWRCRGARAVISDFRVRRESLMDAGSAAILAAVVCILLTTFDHSRKAPFFLERGILDGPRPRAANAGGISCPPKSHKSHKSHSSHSSHHSHDLPCPRINPRKATNHSVVACAVPSAWHRTSPQTNPPESSSPLREPPRGR